MICSLYLHNKLKQTTDHQTYIFATIEPVQKTKVKNMDYQLLTIVHSVIDIKLFIKRSSNFLTTNKYMTMNNFWIKSRIA